MKKIVILNWVLKIFIGILLVAIPINEYLRHNISNEALSLIYKDSVLEFTVRMLCFWISILIIALLNIRTTSLSKMAILISKAQQNLK
jgi:hypothetical protein